MKKILFILLTSILFVACSDDDPKYSNLTFEKDNYSLGVYNSRNIPIVSGNGDYTVTTEDKDIINVRYEPSEDKYKPNTVFVEGLKRGTATIKVVDNISNQTQLLNITITKRYLNLNSSLVLPSVDTENTKNKLEVVTDMYLNSFIGGYATIVLIGDEEDSKNNKAYMFNNSINLASGDIYAQGTYRFEKEDGKNYLVLELKKGFKTSTYKYIISGSVNTMKSFLSMETKTWGEGSFIFKPSISLKQDLTENYKSKYPDIKSAVLQIKMNVSAIDPDIPLKLIQ